MLETEALLPITGSSPYWDLDITEVATKKGLPIGQTVEIMCQGLILSESDLEVPIFPGEIRVDADNYKIREQIEQDRLELTRIMKIYEVIQSRLLV